MNYKMLIDAFGGRSFLAHEMGVTDQMVSLWSTRGLPKSYRRRMDLITIIRASDLDDGLKTDVLKFVMDPAN